MTPGKGFLVALVALAGGILIYLAITGRYSAAGQAIRSLPVLPGGASVGSFLAPTAPQSEPAAPIPPAPTDSNAGTSASPTAGRQPPFGG